MAKRNEKDEKRLDFQAEIRRLRQNGPQRLYLLWGPEDYLREHYLQTLKGICLPEGEDSFSYKRMEGPELDLHDLREAIDALPFMTERSFVELQDVDLNRLKEPEKLLDVLSDIPDYCTVVFVQSASYALDGRTKGVKGLRTLAQELEFTSQSQGDLIRWIARRFAAAGKSISLEAAQRLIFISGDLMNRLIPEIEKVAAYAAGDKVTVEDVEAVAHHIPEAQVFKMTEYMAQKQHNNAIVILAELLADVNNEPNYILAALASQMKRLYLARLLLEQDRDKKVLKDAFKIKYDFIVNQLLQSARGFTLAQLKRAVEICAETSYQMRVSSTRETELLKEAVLRIAAGESHAQR